MVIIDFIQTIVEAIGNFGSGFLNSISGFVGDLGYLSADTIGDLGYLSSDAIGDLSSGSSAPEVPVDPDLPVEPEVPVEDAPIEETPEV